MLVSCFRRLAGVVLGAGAIVLSGVSPAEGATLSASSCASSAVQSAINSASSGDTVIVPNGSCTWTSGITITGKAIHLQGQTAGSVRITHNAGGTFLISVTESSAGSVQISKFAFIGGGGTAQTILMHASSNGRPILIHDNDWQGSISAIRTHTNRGVIYKNTINTNSNDRSFVQCKPEDLGMSSWESAHTMGTADTTGTRNLYVEENTITRVPLQAFDSDGNCRIVVRYNTFADSAYTSHGPDTGPYGNRHTELYNNTFTFTNSGCNTPPAILDYFIFVRGGVWVIADNVMPDLSSCYLGNKSEIKMQIQNLRRNSGPMPCWDGGYPMPRQIGRGHNGTSYISDPVYIWGNSGGVNSSPAIVDYGPDQCGGGPSMTQYVQAGRDFVLGARPGYSKYAYPHPLRSGTSGPTTPAPPTNVRIIR
jgi:hypothetical protein